MMRKHHASKAGQRNRPGVDADWQILGQLELPLRANAQLAINAWLSKALTPLHLPTTLLNAILQSAEEAIARATQAEVSTKDHKTRLVVYVPAARPVNRQPWGFFRLEKVAAASLDSCGRSIAFYLYREER